MISLFSLPPALIGALNSDIAKSLGFLAAVGGLSMAFVQVLKDIGPFRQWFNRGFLGTWFQQRLGGEHPRRRVLGWVRRRSQNASLEQGVDGALRELVDLAAGGSELALLDLPVEQLCGQLNSASQVALEYPGRFPHLFDVLVSGAAAGDVAVIARGNPVSIDYPMQSRRTVPPELDRKDPKQLYLEARARVGQYVQRSIDAIQIRLGARWKWWLQLASFASSAAITYAALRESADPIHPHWSILDVLAGCILGGFLAPIARDIVVAIQSQR